MFSDEDIRGALSQKSLVITPLMEQNITPAGYDASVGDLAWIVQSRRRVRITKDSPLIVPPNSTVLIGTAEAIELDRSLIGFVVSKVSLSALGLSHISTSLDPGWSGQLLVPVHNLSNEPILLQHHEPFCTLMFDVVVTRSKMSHNRPPFRTDLTKFMDRLENQEGLRRHHRHVRRSRLIPWGIVLLLAVLTGLSTLVARQVWQLEISFCLSWGASIALVIVGLGSLLVHGPWRHQG